MVKPPESVSPMPTTVSPSQSPITSPTANSSGDDATDSGFLGLEDWEWVLILVAVAVLLACCCAAGIFVWIKYKAWQFNSDWKDDHF
eukprot:CAMPEP_0206182638 /NCGR_PEP_ID=MMETSP0166-20121206/178_1 /ASSEMBLY_ACC=CAM_ASM_000260 /TAXON_ID=95228 /ORGANISM="Vannella robusta, Strain DIVA3 518/3/11/1/6" /LENGTH=86 /DNA_ID=CAMNT_0053597373 /DNA_START=85 /DNA_END=345 /DNA_ORIENTATION=+